MRLGALMVTVVGWVGPGLGRASIFLVSGREVGLLRLRLQLQLHLKLLRTSSTLDKVRRKYIAALWRSLLSIGDLGGQSGPWKEAGQGSQGKAGS